MDIDRRTGIPYYNVKIYLHNEIYSAGTIERCGSPIEVPNIITPEEFELARSRFSNYTRRKKAEKYLLTGKLVCGTCGSKYKGCGNNNSKYNYYRATCNCCKKRFHKDELDKEVLDNIYSILKSDENIEILTDKVYEKLKQRVKNLNSPASKESLIAKKKRLLAMVESGALPGDDPDLRERLSIIDAKLMKFSGASNSQNIINRAMVNSYLLGVKALTKEPTLVGAFINKIEVMPNSSFKITYQVW